MDIKLQKPQTGRRKTAVARVWLKPGTGRISVNGKTFEQYFSESFLPIDLKLPFQLTETIDQYDIICTVKGGGKSSQLGAILLGISRFLVNINAEFKKPLKSQKLLTRDSRMVQSKLYAHRKSRKKRQFSKR